MHRHPWRRLLAWLIDWVFVLVWVGIVAAVRVPLYLAGVIPDMDLVALNVVAALLVIVPQRSLSPPSNQVGGGRRSGNG
jgi:hypothetical protein